MTSICKSNSPDVVFMDYIISRFNANNASYDVPFFDSVINITGSNPSIPQNESFSYDNKIVPILSTFFKKQKSKSFNKKDIRRVYSILLNKIDNIDFIMYFNSPFWKLKNNLRGPILNLIDENNYYLARSLQNNHVYLIPIGYKFTVKFPNIFEKMEY